jgi:tetratricopeptide (TPR) repeat protein
LSGQASPKATGRTVKTLQFFISSPGDVVEERSIAGRVIERLQSEYVGRVVLEPVLWEHEPLVATSTFQHQIVKPSATDVVVAILWSRLGTKLPEEFRREDGSRYESGTEFEFEEAMAGFRRSGKPHLLVYRKTAPPSVRLDDEKDLLERLAQKKKLDVFVDKWFHDKAEGTLIAAFHPFASPSDFEILVENHLRRLIERELPRSVAATAEARAVWKKGSPFRGLEAFEFEHAPVFFGRTRAVSDILQALREQAAEGRSFVLILGMSGGGKSSVVRAGVLPMLTRPGVIEGVGLWRRAVYRPTDVRGDLFAGLAKALLREHALPSLDADGKGPDELAQILRESPQAATTLIRNALQREEQQDGKPNARLALVIDQMEEMYTQEESYTQEETPSVQRQTFIDVIDALARSGRVWVICTLRSDFYPRLANYPKLGALKEGAGQYDLMPPTASEIGQMIRLPANAAGLRFEEDPASIERLDDMLRDAAAGHREILPLLQFTLEELYQRRTEDGLLTLAAYRELGGVEGSLAKRAETVFKQLPDDVQAELPRVLNELVSIGHDPQAAIGRKRAPRSDLSGGKSRLLVDAFVDNRLFVTELADDGSAVVTVAHEALLWHWPRITDWVGQNRESLRIRARIAAAAQRWDSEKRPHDLLLPAGKPLIEAETLLEYGIELHQDEAQFIQASMARARRLQRLKAGVVATVAFLGLVAVAFAFIANQQRRLAKDEATTANQITNFMLRLFEVSDPSEARGNTITAREIMDRGAERIQKELAAQPRIQATLMETMGTVYTSLGLYDQAVSLLESSLEKRKSLRGDYQLEVARSLDRLGEVLNRKGEYGRALSMNREALALRREKLGDEHADTARSVYELAYVLGLMGEFAEAEPLFREALAVRRTLAGAQSPEVAQSTEGLALNLFDQGKFEEAVSLMREAVAMQRNLHDGPHPQLADALNNLGWVLGEMGHYKEAEQLYQEALEMQRVLVGNTHPFIAIGLNNVAFVQTQQGKYETAEALYLDAMTMQRKLLGEDHPDVALALNNLAYLAHDKGDLKKAARMSQDSLEMYRRTLGEEHPLVAQGMNSLAMWLIEDGDLASAEPLVRQAVEMRRKLLGPDHSDVATSMTLLAGLLVDSGRYEEALALARDAKAIWVKALAPGHWRLASADAVEGAALAGLGRYDEAEKLLLASYGVLHEEKGAAHVYVVNSSRWLAKLYQSTGQPAKAARYRVGQHG